MRTPMTATTTSTSTRVKPLSPVRRASSRASRSLSYTRSTAMCRPFTICELHRRLLAPAGAEKKGGGPISETAALSSYEREELGLDNLGVRRELTDLEHDVAVEVVRLTGDAVLRAVLAERTDRVGRAARRGAVLDVPVHAGGRGAALDERADRVGGPARRGAVLDVPVPAVGLRNHLDVRRGEVHPDGGDGALRRLNRVEVVVDRVLLTGRTDRAHVGHRPLLLRAIDRVEQVGDRDGRDDADDRHDDQQLDEGETTVLAHWVNLLSGLP